MADLAVTDLTFTITRELSRTGGTRSWRRLVGTILIPATPKYPTGGVPISGVTNSSSGEVVAANALACPGLGCPNELVELTVISAGNAAGLDDALDVLFDRGVSGTTPHKLRILQVPASTPAGTVAAPTFTGAALAAHGHVLHLNQADVVDGAGTRVNAATNLIGANSGADIEIASVADATGSGGIIRITAGTPAGTNSAPAFTGTAITASRLTEFANANLDEALTVYVSIIGY